MNYAKFVLNITIYFKKMHDLYRFTVVHQQNETHELEAEAFLEDLFWG